MSFIVNSPTNKSDDVAVRTSLENLFLDAVDLSPVEQREFIRVHCEGDRESAAALEGLLAGERKTRDLSPWSVSDLRFGPYRVTGRIGEGGMGVVYLAVRDDSEYQKDVAVKLIRRGMDTDLIVARFRNERQILANLDHPNIARMLDGGTDQQGSPYLVMEYVEGQSLTDYLEHHKPDLRARLELFRQICSAVHYAHQRMVIHRDLKPRNILVTVGGHPKLLDFGVAKLLEAGGDAEGSTAQMLTPAYASPEQVRGEQVTTASDVYSLGVILYEILTGRSPYRSGTTSPSVLLREICEQEPGRPSLNGSRELKGDLDNIVLMALRKDPSRRYASVDRLSRDIERYLHGFPVEARGDSFAYVAGKFVRRNRVLVIAAALVLLMAVSSVVSIVRSAAVARVERAKAEGRLNDVRAMAHSFIFDIDTALDGIPAALPVRVLINQKAEAYLDRISADAPTDLPLRRELATSYNQLARVQGVPGHGNLGFLADARASLNKAMKLLEGSLAIDPKSYLDHGLLIAVYNSLGQLEWSTGDPAAALAAHEKGLKETETLLAHIPHPPTRLLSAAGSAYLYVALDKGANYSNLGDPVSCLPLLQRSLELFRSINDVKEPISEPYLSEYRNLANVERVLAGLLYQLDRPVEAEAHYQRAMDFLHSPRVDLRETNSRSVLLATETWHAYWLTTQADLTEALPLSKSAFHLAEELLHEDPKNQLGLLYRHHAEFVFGRAEVLSGAIADGFEHIEHALQSEEEILESDRGFAYANGFLTTHSVMAGSTALGAGRGADAKRHFERAVVLATEQSTAHPSDAQALFNLSQAEFGLAEADPTSATEHRAKAREAARRILQVHPDNPWAQKLARK
jgi:tetratricopeptide (TPR) repeat protein/tRNA A-37 threonylcarbamoyl transferase component Bud32